MTTVQPTQPPPEAAMIERFRKAKRPSLSIRAAASQAGMSDTRWRQITAGYQIVAKDYRVPVIAPAETLARMAVAVGAGWADLFDTGREDAADAFRDLQDPGHKERDASRDAWERSPEGDAELESRIEHQNRVKWVESGDGTPPLSLLTDFTDRQLADELVARLTKLRAGAGHAEEVTESQQGQGSPTSGGASRPGAPMKPPSREAARRRQESALSRAETAGHPNPEEVAALDRLGRKAHSTSQRGVESTDRDH